MVAFKQAQLSGLTISNPSSLQFGPDGRLYISQDNGVIVAASVTADGAGGYSVTAKETINLVRFIPNHDDDGTFNAAITTRQVTGILVTGTAANPIVYVSSSDPRIGGGASKGDTGLDTNSGTLSRLTKSGNSWVKEDLVIGLPRSEENHAVNGLQINPENGHILLTVGGQTNAGAPSQEFGYLSDYAYGASIVDIDVAAIDQLASRTYRGQTYKYALPTVDDPTRAAAGDVVAVGQPEVFGGNNGLNQARLTAGSPVQIYATGFRNLYDIAVNESGQLYGIDNGGNPTWGGPPLYRQPDGTLGTTPNSSVTNAINDGSGSINKAPLHLIEKGYYGGHATPVRANPTGAGLYHQDGTPVTLPTDWPPVPSGMANPINGYYLPPGSDRATLLPDALKTPLNLRGEIATFAGSVNGIDDYRSNAFSGEMKGDLIAASLNDDSIYRIDLSADGKTVLGVTNLTPTGVLGNGSALDVHAAPEGGPFGGTLWVASYGGGITVLTPDNSGAGPGPTNQDTDNDGLDNAVDPFPVDATNGQSVVLEGGSTLTWSFSQNEPHPGPGGIGNLGFTGVMTNGTASYTTQYDPNRTIMGGAASGVLIQDITAGSPLTNTQTDAYQFGVDIASDVSAYTVTAKVNNPFDAVVPHGNQSVGFYIGTGDQANYIRLVAGAGTFNGLADTPLITVTMENGDVLVAQQSFQVPIFGAGGKAITASDAFLLSLVVDPLAGVVIPRWTISRGSSQTDPGDVFSGQGDPIAVTGELLAALKGNHVASTPMGVGMATGLAVGIIGTSDGPGDPFPATWNSINISADAKPMTGAGLAELIVTPGAGIDVSTFEANTLRLSNLAGSGSDLQQVIINLQDAILPDGVFFDPNAAGGDNGKPFHIDSQTGAFSAVASYQNGSAGSGYRQLVLDFNGFNAGESLSFSLDIDPDSMRGFKQSVTPGGVSGAELAGAHISYVFADGSHAEAQLFGSGVAQAEARGVASLHMAPSVSLQGMTSGNITFPAADPTITVQGAPGSSVRVEMMAVAQLNVPFASQFEGNSATSVVYETIILDASGQGTVSASLVPDRVLIVAAAEVDTSGSAISAVSLPLRIVEQSGSPPSSIVGTNLAETLEGTNGDDSFDARGGNDRLNGLDGSDFLDGGLGADVMAGGAGDDVYVVDDASDSVVEEQGKGSDTVRTSLAAYTLGAELENLTYTGTKNFTGAGNALANVLTGSSGADRLDGLAGSDLMKGGLGNDTYVVDNVADIAVEFAGQGTDRVLAQVSYTLSDNIETLQLTTSKAINGTGNAQANMLVGNAAANALDGGGGADVLTGGAGNDRFLFAFGDANGDRVTDFAGAGIAGGDQLVFTGYGSDATLSRVGTSDFYVIYAGAAHNGVLETIQISGVTNLTSEDYAFLAPANQAPTDILLSGQSLLENSVGGTVVGTLSAVDPDGLDTATFSLLDSAGGRFQLSGSNLVATGPLDFEKATSYTVGVQLADGAGHLVSKSFVIAIADANDMAPVITTPADIVVNENQTQVVQLSAQDGDQTGEPVTFSIDPHSADAALFMLEGSTLSFKLPPDYESTTHSPAYVVDVIASDGLNSSVASLHVQLADVSEQVTIFGTTGADTLTYSASSGYDRFDGLGGADVLQILNRDSVTLASGSEVRFDFNHDGIIDFASIHVERLELSGNNVAFAGSIAASDVTSLSISGTGGDDSLDGSLAGLSQTLQGGAGNDMLVAGSGADLLDGGEGADQMAGGNGDDVYIVNAVTDVVIEKADAGTDTVQTVLSEYALGDHLENLVYTGSGNFVGTGNEDANMLLGGVGRDRLDGSGGADIMKGGAGSDTYLVDNAADIVTELLSQGTNDRVLSQVSFTLSDNIETLQLTTSQALNGTGNGIANTLVGNAGINQLNGRGGADVLTGGGGNDIFLFQRGEAGGDVITDFSGAGTVGGDRLNLIGYGAGGFVTQSGNSDFYTIHAGPGQGSFSETIQLMGVTNLDSGDWLFV